MNIDVANTQALRVGYGLKYSGVSPIVYARVTQFNVRRFALVAALLLLAAQTIVVQHIHADAAGPVCVVCASTAQHASLPAAVAALPIAEACSTRLTPSQCLAPKGERVHPGRARAPPTL